MECTYMLFEVKKILSYLLSCFLSYVLSILNIKKNYQEKTAFVVSLIPVSSTGEVFL